MLKQTSSLFVFRPLTRGIAFAFAFALALPSTAQDTAETEAASAEPAAQDETFGTAADDIHLRLKEATEAYAALQEQIRADIAPLNSRLI